MPTNNAPRDSPEQVCQIPVDKIHPFPDHPFRVVDDELMQQTVDSISQFGILNPTIVRPLEKGEYEMVSGHRRLHAAELAGLDSVPAIIRNLTNDEAIILMVDSNIQRENILPSERAKAYKMKLEAIKHQGKRADLTSTQVAQKLSVERVADEAGTTKDQIRRYIRLTELQPELQQMVDEVKMAMTPAVEISYLKPDEQKLLLETIDSEQATPSLSQAQRMKKLSQEGKLDDDTMLGIMMEQKKPEGLNITLPINKVRKFFPASYTPRQIENIIFKLLESWQKKRQNQISK